MIFTFIKVREAREFRTIVPLEGCGEGCAMPEQLEMVDQENVDLEMVSVEIKEMKADADPNFTNISKLRFI